ncbi:AmmeMemoRadiSam system radical SAM enzyme [Peptococcaceae bacterium]|nr:AmmeMemoRadiSam system radical SAM enzyme [Peptococcaceae bacterium]
MKEAMFWHVKDKEKKIVACELCPKRCIIRQGETGFCRVRKNLDGKLYTLNFGRLAAHAMDPIEKKPLYHYYPGKYILSIGTFGCNLRCGFCQNWTIAHGNPDTLEVTPEDIVNAAVNQEVYPNIGIAYTYSEPTVWYEFVYQTAKLAKQKRLKNVLVTNGYINEEPLRELLPFVDALNIDVKAFTDKFYKRNCVGELKPVLRSVKIAFEYGCHIELTTLLIPGLNDDENEIRELAGWIASMSKDISLHFSRYMPNFLFKIESTPPETLFNAQKIAFEKLNYVYIGNLGDPRGLNTYCSRCKKILVNRSWYNGKVVGIDENGRCKHCGERIPIFIS